MNGDLTLERFVVLFYLKTSQNQPSTFVLSQHSIIVFSMKMSLKTANIEMNWIRSSLNAIQSVETAKTKLE